MNKSLTKEQASPRKRGLRLWGNGRNDRFGGLLRDRDGFHREMDQMFDEFLRGMGTSPSVLDPWTDGDLIPDVDLSEDDKAYLVTMELPGMDQDDVEVSYSDGLLTISGEKEQESEEKEKNFYRRERSFGSFHRCLPVAGGVDEGKIDASLKKGILSIRLPKTKEAQSKPKKINIKSAS